MKDPYELIFQSFAIADAYIARPTGADAWEDKNIFFALMLLERLIDKQRVLVPPGASATFPQRKKEVEKRLGELRVVIGQRGKEVGEEKTTITYSRKA